MSRSRLSPRALSRWQISAACTIVCVSSCFAAPRLYAQDSAEAARQEKARKAAQPQKQQPHVYTNEDLQRSQILTQEDRTVAEARKKNAAPPAVNEASPSNAPAQEAAATESLGEIARRIRREKAARQAEQARKVPPPSPFPMELPHETNLAHPKPLSPALIAPSASPSKPFKPATPSGSVKRDPFSRAAIPAAPRSNSVSAPMPNPILPSTPAPPPIVAPPTTMHSSPVISKTHVDSVRIQPGDSLWDLSRQYLGKGSRWQEWLSHNPGIGDPRRMQPGTVLLVPPGGIKSAAHSEPETILRPEVHSPGTISVRPGDSLWKIAAQHLGGGTDWPCLAHANPNLPDVDLIYPGQSLILPATCTVGVHPRVALR